MILFSPLGNTDPIRDFHDGACLHIVRHYLNQGLKRVVLFFTAEMEKKEDAYQPYTRAIKKIAPAVEIEKIYTGIKDAHLYDSFIKILPQNIYKLHENFPDEEILLNLSSGTPQIKNLLAIIAIETNWSRAVQVSSPAEASNLKVENVSDAEEFQIMLDDNLDDKPNAKNRCLEPPLRVLRLYNDKNKILSLIAQYEYTAALTIAKQNPNIPDEVNILLEHAALRLKLRTTDAKKFLPKYNGKNLFPFGGTQEKLLEYLLTIQADREIGNLSSVLIKTVPFLYEILAEYVLRDEHLKVKKSCEMCKVKNSPLQETNLELKRALLEKNNSELLDFLDKSFGNPYRDSFLSEKILKFICAYAADLSANNIYKEITQKLKNIENRNVIDLRNQVAHIITDVDENKFFNVTGMSSNELVEYFFRMMILIYGEEIKIQRTLYRNINQWIQSALEK